MEISGYKIIIYKTIQRSWGLECRFTAQRLSDGTLIDDVVPLNKDEEKDEKALASAVSARIIMRQEAINAPLLVEPATSTLLTAESVEVYLRENGYLKEDQTLASLKDAVDSTAKEG